MDRPRKGRWSRWTALAVPLAAIAFAASIDAEDEAVTSVITRPSPSVPPAPDTASDMPLSPPRLLPTDQPLPINLPTALQLANVEPLDISVASARIRLAC